MRQGFYRVSRTVFGPMLRGAWRIRKEGVENIPEEGGAILASNHLSYLDHFLLPAVVPRPIFFISKAQHFDVPVQRWFFKQWGVIPLARGEGDNAAIDRALEVLQDGELFGIYPEGTRSLDGKLHKGHTGVARLALELDVPVIPVAMLGTFEKKPKGRKGMDHSVKLGGIAGPPLRWPALVGKHNDRDVCRQVTDEIMHAIAELSGQDYVDEYTHNPEVPGYDRKEVQA